MEKGARIILHPFLFYYHMEQHYCFLEYVQKRVPQRSLFDSSTPTAPNTRGVQAFTKNCPSSAGGGELFRHKFCRPQAEHPFNDVAGKNLLHEEIQIVVSLKADV